MKTVGIIGAGAAGLCALKHVLNTNGLSPIVWEKTREIGGTWVYKDTTGNDEFGLPNHSSMYKNLKTNLPKEVMGFPDFPFKPNGPSFITHKSVLQYLDDYAENFELKKHINFFHLIEEVTPVNIGDPSTQWRVRVKNLLSGDSNTTICDSLFVCNGHYTVPHTPLIPGMESFSGLKDHSHNYRVPETYRDKTVIVLGASASGQDISLDIAAVAKKVYLSHNLPLPIPSALPANMEQVPGVVSAKEDKDGTFVLKDGREIEANAFLFCTGYEYSYPFLSEDCEVKVTNNQVWPLYRHLIHCKYPTMALVGIPFQICPFPYFDIQIRYFVSTLTGVIELPPCEELMGLFEKDMQQRRSMNQKQSHYHAMASCQWQYVDELKEDIVTSLEKLVAAEGADEEVARFARDNLFPDHIRALFKLTVLHTLLQFSEMKKYDYDFVTEEGSDFSIRQVFKGELTSTRWSSVSLVLRVLPPYVLKNLFKVIPLLLNACYYKVKKLLVT